MMNWTHLLFAASYNAQLVLLAVCLASALRTSEVVEYLAMQSSYNFLLRVTKNLAPYCLV